MSDAGQRHSSSTLSSLISIHYDSIRILLDNPKPFLALFLLTTLPLALLISTISASTHSLQSQIYHLEALALRSSTRFEARHIWQESRSSAVSLIRFKAVFLVPLLALSLVSSVSVCGSVVEAHRGKKMSLLSSLTLFRGNWKRPLGTSLLVYSVRLAYAAVFRVLSSLGVGVVVGVIGALLEVHIMAVLGVALVASMEENVVGCEAMVIGFWLTKGKRVVGWMVTALVLGMASLVGWKMEEGNGSRDVLREYEPAREKLSIVLIGFGGGLWLVVVLGLVLLWSYVVTAVFYCECRRRNNVVVSAKGEDGCSEDEAVLPSVIGLVSVEPTLLR